MKLIKHFTLNSVKKTKICNYCLMETCTCNKMEKKTTIFEFDLSRQLCAIIRKNWDIILAYKGNLL